LRIRPAWATFQPPLRLSGSGVAVARPVAARIVGGRRERPAVELRAGQHLVSVGIGRRLRVLPIAISGNLVVVEPRHDLAFFREPRTLRQVVAHPREIDRVSMQVGEIAGDRHALEVVPRPGADPIAGVDGRLTGAGLRAEVRAPGSVARADGLGELLTVRICARQSTKAPSVADGLAGDEEGHRRAARHTVLRERHGGRDTRQSQDCGEGQDYFHAQPPAIVLRLNCAHGECLRRYSGFSIRAKLRPLTGTALCHSRFLAFPRMLNQK